MARGSSVGNPVPYIMDYLEQGLSATAALGEFRSQGLGISTQTWYRAWGQGEAAIANEATVGRIAYDVVPSFGDYVEWSAGSRPAFAHQVSVIIAEPLTGITRTLWHTVISDIPLSPTDATQTAIDEMNAQLGDNQGYGRAIGAALTNLFYMTGQP